jgi:hypothetical protein
MQVLLPYLLFLFFLLFLLFFSLILPRKNLGGAPKKPSQFLKIQRNVREWGAGMVNIWVNIWLICVDISWVFI